MEPGTKLVASFTGKPPVETEFLGWYEDKYGDLLIVVKHPDREHGVRLLHYSRVKMADGSTLTPPSWAK